MKEKFKDVEYTTVKKDLREIFDGLYGGNQHLSTWGLKRFGCGAVTLHTYDGYINRNNFSRDDLVKGQDEVFMKYLLGPTTALRFKLTAMAFYRLRGKSANVKIIHSYLGHKMGLRKMMMEIKNNIDQDNPVPLIIGLKVRQGYEDSLRSHWVTVTGYAEGFMVLISNNGRKQSLNLESLSKRRMFIAAVPINVEPINGQEAISTC